MEFGFRVSVTELRRGARESDAPEVGARAVRVLLFCFFRR